MNTYNIQPIQHANRRLPVDTRIGNRNPIFQARRSFGRDILLAFVDMGLDHYTGDTPVAGAKLCTNIVKYFWLIIMVLL